MNLRPSISRTIVALALGSSVLGLSIAFTAVTAYDYLKFQQLARQELATIGSIYAAELAQTLSEDPDRATPQLLRKLRARPNIDLACMYIGTGDDIALVAAVERGGIPCPARPVTRTAVSAVQPIVRETSGQREVAGALLLRMDPRLVSQHALDSALVYLVVMLVAALLATLAARLFTRRVLLPLRDLRNAASEVATGHRYALRVRDYGNDEIGDLANAFNQMLSVIQNENQMLVESERRFRLISERSQVGILQLDAVGKGVYVNDEALRITGLAREAVTIDRITALVHPDDRRRVQEQIQKLLVDGVEINLECCLYLPTGDLRWVSGHMAPLSPSEGNTLGLLATINDITELRVAYDQLEQMAFYDNLTGLANRRLFRDRLEHMLGNMRRSGGGFTLILLDLDHFKHINDTLGHDSGDLLLSVIAERLKQCVRYTDTVARLGGDEFAVILPNIHETLAASAIAEKILSTLARPVMLDAHEIDVRASLGIAMAPADTVDAEALIKYADLALYRAKDEGRNKFHFYTAEMNTLLIEHLRLVQDLRHAVEHREFALQFQPQVHLATGELVGFEALLRWNHPERGGMPTQAFIAVAEESDLIIPLGRWIIDTACQQMSELCQRQLVSRRAVMAINLSLRQLHDVDFVSYLNDCLSRHGLRPAQLELELTEGILMENLETALHQLQEIKALGVSLSIDDFGTGYSSLGYLKRLPVNVIKVDRSFVMDIPHERDDMEITSAVIAMAHKLRYKVVAEGIESSAQYQFLRDSDCDFGQGYFISHPLAPDELIKFCEEYQQHLEQELTARHYSLESPGN